VAVDQKAIAEIRKLLGAEAATRLAKNAREIDRIERKGSRALERVLDHITERIAGALAGDASMPSEDYIDDLLTAQLLDHWRDTSSAGIKETGGGVEVVGDTVVQLARRKKIKGNAAPRNMRELRELYDFFRKNPEARKRFADQAKKIRKLYLKKINEYVRQRTGAIDVGAEANEQSSPFRKVTRAEIAVEVKKKVAVAYSRAKMTLETETTRNYNATRRAVYDTSPDVTHYLFVAVRDFRTTKWCKSRDKLVYKKGDPLLDKETPPIHWNCRSEMLPLTPQNPVHLRLINSKEHSRRNHSCEPMPRGWISSRAA
jgi:SPP1 gp7 family putative phage head morphogenesis protein